MGIASAIIQSLAESEGRKYGNGSWLTRVQLSGNPEMLTAYNQGITNGIERRIADQIEAGNRRYQEDNDPDSLKNWLKRELG